MNAAGEPDAAEIRGLGMAEAVRFYDSIIASGDADAVRWLAKNDRFFLLGCLMGREDVLGNRWCFDRCREVEASPEGWLDLWSRFHYKSTIITLAGSIQEIIKDPDVTIGILSYNKATAAKFVDQIRRSLENPFLVSMFPDILWDKPPPHNWSTQYGLIVKRRSNPKEPTIQGSGLVDGQPVGAHYSLRIYDDVVVPVSVSSPEQIKKTTEAWELSLALGQSDGGRAWYCGTRYHPSDTYSEILRRGALKERRRLCVTPDGEPTMMTREAMEKLRGEMGAFTWAAQMLQNPIGAGVRVFQDDWLEYYTEQPNLADMNVAVIIDSANAKRKDSDYTTMWVVGLHGDGNYYLLDGVHDRLSLTERTEELFRLEEKWANPRVFWEQAGAMSDVSHVREIMDRDAYHFPLTEIRQTVPKGDRIRWLEPLFRSGKVWLPRRMLRRARGGETRDLVRDLVEEEFSCYPTCRHDDMLDCLANVCHPGMTVKFPLKSRRDGGRPKKWAANRR